jgi:two-component system CheB/CheR fusion protein
MDDNERKILAFPPSDPGITPSHLTFFVVGIGASAGGITALQRFLEATPSDSGMAFVIVLHLSPNHESNIAQILQPKTKMPVRQVNDEVAIEPNHVYVIPPNRDLRMQDGKLQIIAAAARLQGRHTAIDLFFRTLAEAHRERAVGIILSGAGADGAVGIARIKEKGGMTVVQTPEDAEYDSMPNSALRTGMVDIVLPVAEMPQKLIDLARNASEIRLPAAVDLDQAVAGNAASPSLSADEREQAIRDILALLHRRTGHEFRHYKRATVLRRLERRLQVNGLPNVLAYYAYLEQHPEETPLLLQDMLISVTNFFRDREAFEALERDVIPAIFRQATPSEAIRAWSIGCATGEEAYSIAMLLMEQNDLGDATRPLQIFASDIDEHALQIARRGMYPESIITDVPPARLRQYFEREDQHYCVQKDAREKLLFAVHNVLRDPPFSRMHLISCRNLLIYLDREVQKNVFEMMHYALHPDGFLFLGNAESADAVPELFVPVDKKHRIYQASKSRASRYYVPMPPQFASRIGSMPAMAEAYKPAPPRSGAMPQQQHWLLLQEYAPPSVLLDQHNNLVYATAQAARFLQPPSGEPTHNILSLVHPDLQLELRAALFQAAQTGARVETRHIPLRLGNETSAVRILVGPAAQRHGAEGMTLLLFQESAEHDVVNMAAANAAENTVALVLENELHSTKEQLRSLINQYESTLADLKASNEELQAVNEELRSAMEELETSKEELQSVNEELVTVNLELKSKVDETTKANDDLQNFLAATEIAIIFVNRNICIKRYSKPASRLFNIISSDVGRPLPDITHRLQYSELVQDIQQVFDKLQPNEREVQSNDGEWYIARFLPYRTASDHIEGIVLTFMNISRRKAAEENMRASEQRMRLISASTRDYAILTMDSNGVITSWNGGAERLFGYAEAEILGQSGAILYPPEDRAAGHYQMELRQARENGRAEDDRWHARKDGSQVYCSGITSPLADDSIQGFVKIARDLTGSKRAQELQAARLEWEQKERIRAQEAARLRDEFFAVLSHELKQPLNLIQLTAEMLSRMPDAANQPAIKRSAATIQRSVESQVRIINDLMDLSRLHTGKLSLNRTQVDFGEVVAHVVEVVRPDAQHKEIALNFKRHAASAIVHGDVIRIEQIVWNLLSNAIKFTPARGRVEVRIDCQDEFACLEVTDTGRGIPTEFLPFVFDMFKQADNGMAREFGGMGIGLALVQELANSHGGRVEAASDGIGKGAQFRVYLPLSLAMQPAAPSAVHEPDSLAGKRILLIEDASDMLALMAELLSMQGGQLSTASNGAEALQKASQEQQAYDLIISDIGMPGMDGCVLLAELRKLQATAGAPAIALSGFTRESDVQRALAAGFDAHVRKPLALNELLALANKLVRRE